MKNKLALLILFLALVLPIMAGAHSGSVDFNELQTPEDVMVYVEHQIFGGEIHFEIENLIVKMLAGSLSETEVDRITELMNEHPAAYSMTFNRIFERERRPEQTRAATPWADIMSFNSLWAWAMALGLIVWLIAGLLLIIWILKHV